MPAEVFADNNVIASPHSRANAAAAEIYANGGNAFDAAVATCLVLCVIAPQSVGLAGYGGTCIAYLGKKKIPVAIDFDSRAPLAYHDEIFADPATRRFGFLAVTVPGVVAGLDFILREYGTISFAAALKHAARIATEGFVPDPICYKEMQAFTERGDESSQRAFFGDAGIPAPNVHWIPCDLAHTMDRLINYGPADMYRGQLADEIISFVRSNGGILTKQDFDQYTAQLVDPLHISYRGYDLFTPPPPSGGLTIFQVLKILSHVDPNKLKKFDARSLHLVAEALKIGWKDRDLLGDPDFTALPIADLLGDAKAKAGAAEILTGKIGSTSTKADSGIHTVNICAFDSDQNAVSLTATTGFLFGSQCVVPGTGLILGHGMSRFDFIKNHPNAPAPGKRMQHNMAPCLAIKNGRPSFIIGLPGGTRIVSVTAQMVVELIDMNMSPSDVTSASRIHTEGAEPLTITDNMPEPLVTGLTQIGHKLSKERTVGGPSNAIAIHPDGKIFASTTARQEAWVPTERS
ncbi:MAG TPA: gamma-glutamyltransferase [Tepidisphaeraceae bacterium]|jgi:gamma-glutamyltranspeptidase/glutathione hydrolase